MEIEQVHSAAARDRNEEIGFGRLAIELIGLRFACGRTKRGLPEHETPPSDLLAALEGRFRIKSFELATETLH